MNANQADAKVATRCRVLGVSTSGCSDRLDRPPSARSIDDAVMTYVPAWAGFSYLAVVLDAWSRPVVGWAIGHDMTALVLKALNMALQQRKSKGV